MAGLMDTAGAPPMQGGPQPGMGQGMQPGMEPPQEGGFGEVQATPEEQAIYDRFVDRALFAMTEPAMIDQIEGMLKEAPTPQEGIGAVSATIFMRVYMAAKEAGQEVPGDVAIHAGQEVVENVYDFAEARGIIEDSDQDEDAIKEGGWYVALDMVRAQMQEQGMLDQQTMQSDLSMLQQADQSGMLEQELMGLASIGPEPEETGEKPGKGAPPPRADESPRQNMGGRR